MIGMAFGTGSAVAHRAVDAVLGPRTIQHETVAAAAPEATTNSTGGADACSIHSKAFQDVWVSLPLKCLINSHRTWTYWVKKKVYSIWGIIIA